jgi:hypothetical protein
MTNARKRDPIEELRRELEKWRRTRWVVLAVSIAVIGLGEYYNLRAALDIGQIAEAARDSPGMALILEDLRAQAYARHSSNVAIAALALALVAMSWRRVTAKALLELNDRIASAPPEQQSNR